MSDQDPTLGSGEQPSRLVVSRRVAWRVFVGALWGRGAWQEWREQAACREHDPSWWDGGQHRTPTARAVCQECPVRAACLADAIAWETATATRARNTFGVLGGLTATERAALYRAVPSVVGVGDATRKRRAPRAR